jgi:hypothetical protein
MDQGIAGDFSGVDSFTVMAAPAVPILIRPVSPPLDTLTLKWRAVSTALGYECQFSGSPTFSPVLAMIDSTIDTTFRVTSLHSRTKYYWKVRAYNIGGASVFGVDSFTTVIEVPGQPSLFSPGNYATEVVRRTVFSWNPVLNALSYHLQVATAAFPTSGIVVDTVASDTTLRISDTLDVNTTYYWRVSGINLGGEGSYSATAQFTTGSVTDVEAYRIEIPKEYALMQNFPNPFNPSTTLRYGLPARSRVRLRVFNILGQVVADLVNAEQASGWNQIVWNANVASGLYFYRLEAVSLSDPSKRFVDVKKMMLLK